MNRGNNEGHAFLHPHSFVFGGTLAYPPLVIWDDQGNPASHSLASQRHVQRNREPEEVEDGDSEDSDSAPSNWVEDFPPYSYDELIGLCTAEDRDQLGAAYTLKSSSRLTGRYILGQSHARSLACLLGRSPLAGQHSKSSAALTPSLGNGPRCRRRSEEASPSSTRSPVSRGVYRQGQQQSREKRRASSRPTTHHDSRQSVASNTSELTALQSQTDTDTRCFWPRASPTASGGSRRGSHLEVSLQTIDGHGSFEESGVELQSRKRRRAEASGDPNPATSSVPGFRSRLASLNSTSAHDNITVHGSVHTGKDFRLPVGQQVCVRPGGGMSVKSPASEQGRAGFTQKLYTNLMSTNTTHNNFPSSNSSSLSAYPSRVVYLAELIPRRIRRDILQLFRIHAPYLSHVIGKPVNMVKVVSKLTEEWCHPRKEFSLYAPWPKGSIPFELFERIGSYLSRDDLLNCRLVNGEFEKNFSTRVFKAVVVPFSPDIYSTTSDSSGLIVLPIAKGNSRGPGCQSGLDNDRIKDGMQIFRSWGPVIKKFALSSEIDEASLANPPEKPLYKTYTSFWGTYKWPYSQYQRFSALEDKERTFDDARCMKLALSMLTAVTELGLSVDSGLGWLSGPDISDRARLLRRQTPIFNTQYADPSDEEIDQVEIWEGLRPGSFNARRPTFQTVLMSGPNLATPYIEWAISQPQAVYPPLIFEGIDLEAYIPPTDENPTRNIYGASPSDNPFLSSPLIPSALTDGQNQWLLENEWAQLACMSSFCMSLTDNATLFQHLRTLNFAKLSSRYLSGLAREDLWKALPQIQKLILLVSPDWRDIKMEGVVVRSPAILPSGSAMQVYCLLEDHIRPRENITHLEIGWIGGGERAQGIFARSKSILPAPILNFGMDEPTIELQCRILSLPHVQNLTLRNCWLAPPTLKQFVQLNQSLNMRNLTLNSVSLTAVPGRRTAARPTGAVRITNRFSPPPGMYFQSGPILDTYLKSRQEKAPAGGHVSGTDATNPYQQPSPSCLQIKNLRSGSWPEVIDTITPGHTIAHEKYLQGHTHDSPEPRNVGSLRRVEFISCGYVRLTNFTRLDQEPICQVVSDPPPCLLQRATDLKVVMMSAENDLLLGQIAPAMAKHESDLLQFVWGMQMGWDADNMSKYETREDGQPVGGSGRFSGVVEKNLDRVMPVEPELDLEGGIPVAGDDEW